MVLDYDRSNLPIDQAELWICFRANSIRGHIVAAQAQRLEFLLALGQCVDFGIVELSPRFSTVQLPAS